MGIDAIPGMDVFPKESVIRRLQVPGFTLYDLRYGDNLYISPRHHAMAHITCLLQGSFKMFYAEMYRTYREGAVLFHPIGQTNAQQFASEASRVLCIQLTEVMMKRLGDQGLNVSNRSERLGGPAAPLARRIFLKFEEISAASLLAVEGLVLELIAELLSDSIPSRWSQLAENASEFIQRNFRNRVTLKEIASVTRVHPVHLAKTFRRAHGCTVGEYTRNLRLDEVRKMLISTGLPILQVAIDCGYADHSHLCRDFRKHFGVSPTAFRRKYGTSAGVPG